MAKVIVHHLSDDDIRCQSNEVKDEKNKNTELPPQITQIENPVLIEAISNNIISMAEQQDCLHKMLQENIDWKKEKSNEQEHGWIMKNYVNMQKELANLTNKDWIKDIYRSRAREFIKNNQNSKSEETKSQSK